MKKYVAIIIAVFYPLLSMGQTIIDLGNKREVFVDDYIIDKLDGVRLQMHTPHDEGAVFLFDKPWEGQFSGETTIIKENDIYRAYYRGQPDINTTEVICCAESRDGIHWEKPDLKLFEVHGTLKNNVVLTIQPATCNFSPFVDTNPRVAPDQRYKAVALGLAGAPNKFGLTAFASPDGLRWRKLQEECVIKNSTFDSQNVAFWSESEQCYLCYYRIWIGGDFTGIRSVARTTSTDFIHWTEPVNMTFGNTPLEQIYENKTAPYFRAPHIYLAVGSRFMPGRQVLNPKQAQDLNVHPDYYKDCSDIILMSTRGGNVYDRTFMETFIRPGIGMENWVSRSNFPALNVVQTGATEMSVYVNQDYAQPTAHLRRYSLRLDGFASLAAPYAGGEVITKAFTFSGSELEINYATSAAGDIRFEIQDANGKPLPGFTLDDSSIIIGNEIARVVRWKSGKSLKELIGTPIRLRIVMKDADLYSIRFK